MSTRQQADATRKYFLGTHLVSSKRGKIAGGAQVPGRPTLGEVTGYEGYIGIVFEGEAAQPLTIEVSQIERVHCSFAMITIVLKDGRHIVIKPKEDRKLLRGGNGLIQGALGAGGTWQRREVSLRLTDWIYYLEKQSIPFKAARIGDSSLKSVLIFGALLFIVVAIVRAMLS